MATYRVMVVEDNHEVRRMVSASIKALDAEIDVLDVPSAEEALLISTSLPLDLVILDIRLPGMSGLEMVTRMRKRTPETKIILVTGIDDANLRQQVSQAGAAAYFFKPIEINAFLDAVRHCLWPEPAEVQKISPQTIATAEPSLRTESATSGSAEKRVPPEARGTEGKLKEPGITIEQFISEIRSVAMEPGISKGPGVSPPPISSVEAGVGRESREESSISGGPVAAKTSTTSTETKASKEPSGGPSASKRPAAVQAPTASMETKASREPSGGPSVSGEPSASGGPAGVTSEIKAISSRGFQPTLDERLIALKLQLGATSVLLVNSAGQVLEMAGNPSMITSDSVLLPALMQAIRASLQVTEAFGMGTSEGLQYFHTMKQCLYLTVVGPRHALLVVMSGYFDPDKLGMIDRAMHLAVQDILTIQERLAEEESLAKVEAEPAQTELNVELPIDKEALAEIEEMFSTAPPTGDKKEADGFWATLEEHGALDGPANRDALSYEQAREMGLLPKDEQ